MCEFRAMQLAFLFTDEKADTKSSHCTKNFNMYTQKCTCSDKFNLIVEREVKFLFHIKIGT